MSFLVKLQIKYSVKEKKHLMPCYSKGKYVFTRNIDRIDLLYTLYVTHVSISLKFDLITFKLEILLH